MVKKSIVLFFILLLCVGCEKTYIEESNEDIKQSNFQRKFFCNVLDDSFFHQINLDCISIDELTKRAGNRKLSPAFLKFIEPKIRYYLYNDSSSGTKDRFIYYTCGKINIRNGVSSYLVLNQAEVFLLNFKNRYLTSIVLISEYHVMDPTFTCIKTYINTKTKSLLLVDNSFRLGIDFNFFYKENIWSRLGIVKPKSLKYFYSSFIIDENGYVKTIPLDKDDFPNYMNY